MNRTPALHGRHGSRLRRSLLQPSCSTSSPAPRSISPLRSTCLYSPSRSSSHSTVRS